jgi:hypothetical protein
LAAPGQRGAHKRARSCTPQLADEWALTLLALSTAGPSSSEFFMLSLAPALVSFSSNSAWQFAISRRITGLKQKRIEKRVRIWGSREMKQ